MKNRLLWILACCALVCCSLAVPARGQDNLKAEMAKIYWPAYQDQTVKLLQEYLRINTSNPPGNELQAAEFFHRLFDSAGIPNTIYEYVPHRADIYAVLKGDGSLRPIVLLSHMDVVRADASRWQQPPFAANIVNGLLYGRGALDMKDEGLLHAMVMLIAAREHLPLKRDLIFLATSDEEVSDTGSTWFLAHHADLVRHAEYLITEGGANLVYPNGKVLYGVGVAEKAPLWLRLVATGPGGHASVPIADSAPNRLVEAANRVVHWQTPIVLLPAVEEFFRDVAPLEKEPLASKFRDIRQSLQDPAFVKELTADPDYNYLLRNTVSLTELKGSSQTNVIPATAYAELDVRLLPGQDPDAFIAQLRQVVDDPGIRIERVNTFHLPNSSSTHTALFRIIEQVVHQYDPQALLTPLMGSGYTESQMYRPLGITAYGFVPVVVTPEEDGTQHAANERIPVAQLRRAVKMLYEVVARAANP